MTNKKFDLGTVVADSVMLITSPRQFFQEMPKTGGYAEPIIHLIVNAVISGLILTIWSTFSNFTNPLGYAAIVVFPIMLVIGSFIAAAVLYVIWRLLGSTQRYETAFRCVAYMGSIAPIISLLAIIPYLSSIIKNVWVFVLIVLASSEVHKLTSNTPKIVFAVLAVLGTLSGLSLEHKERKLANKLEQVGIGDSNYSDEFNEKAAEQMSRNVTALLKGLEEIQKEAEKQK